MMGPRAVARAPKASVAREALNLLAAFGAGDSDLKNTLTEMVSAIEQNEQLVAKITKKLELLEGLEARERLVTEVEARSDRKLANLRQIMTDFDEYRSKPGES